MYSYRNEKTGEVVTCGGWTDLAEIKKRSIAKGHVWRQLRYIPLMVREGHLVPVGEC